MSVGEIVFKVRLGELNKIGLGLVKHRTWVTGHIYALMLSATHLPETK